MKRIRDVDSLQYGVAVLIGLRGCCSAKLMNLERKLLAKIKPETRNAYHQEVPHQFEVCHLKPLHSA